MEFDSEVSKSAKYLNWIKNSLPYFVWGLFFFGFSIEHGYCKPWRHFAKSLLSSDIPLPLHFDKRIYLYISDFLAAFLMAWAFLKGGARILLNKGAWLLGIILLLAGISIYTSCLSSCAIPYFRLTHLFGAFCLFIGITNTRLSKERMTKLAFLGIVITGAFQSLVAISQYFLQGPIGLFLLNEPKTSYTLPSRGYRWLFDRFFSATHGPFLYRATGTFSHCNVLGGSLACSLLITTYLFFSYPKKRWWIGVLYVLQLLALILTFSRSALYAYIFGSLFWSGWLIFRTNFEEKKDRLRALYPVLTLVFASIVLSMILFSEQLYHRGMILNQYTTIDESGAVIHSHGLDRYRLQYQNIALLLIQKNPLFGVGYTLFEPGARECLSGLIDPSQIQSTVHNIYLLLAAEVGIFSLIAFLSWIALLLYAAWRSPPTPLLGILFAIFFCLLLIGCCDFYPLVAQPARILFFTIAALIGLHSRPYSNEALLKT